MKAIILAAGRSTRLYPITLEHPKCLLPIGGKTLIEHQITWLNMCGIDDILVVNGYLNHMIEEKLGSRVRYRFYENFAETNNLYTLHSINDELDDDGEPVLGPQGGCERGQDHSGRPLTVLSVASMTEDDSIWAP